MNTQPVTPLSETHYDCWEDLPQIHEIRVGNVRCINTAYKSLRKEDEPMPNIIPLAQRCKGCGKPTKSALVIGETSYPLCEACADSHQIALTAIKLGTPLRKWPDDYTLDPIEWEKEKTAQAAK